MDPQTQTMFPEDQAARRKGRSFCLDAVREWVLTGRHALGADDEAGAKLHDLRDRAGAAISTLGAWLDGMTAPGGSPGPLRSSPLPVASLEGPGEADIVPRQAICNPPDFIIHSRR